MYECVIVHLNTGYSGASRWINLYKAVYIILSVRSLSMEKSEESGMPKILSSSAGMRGAGPSGLLDAAKIISNC